MFDDLDTYLLMRMYEYVLEADNGNPDPEKPYNDDDNNNDENNDEKHASNKVRMKDQAEQFFYEGFDFAVLGQYLKLSHRITSRLT